MSKTISLVETATDNRIVFMWQNISHFYKLWDQDGTRVHFISGYEIHVNESVSKIEQAIEQAARNEQNS